MSRFLRADACPSLATRSVGWDFSLKVRACASVTTASYAGSERRLRAQEPTVQDPGARRRHRREPSLLVGADYDLTVAGAQLIGFIILRGPSLSRLRLALKFEHSHKRGVGPCL